MTYLLLFSAYEHNHEQKKKPMPKNRAIAKEERGNKQGQGKLKGETAKTSGKVGAKGRRGESDNDL